LGLAVVYGMVRDVGGEVGVERAALGGARFVVTLPAANQGPSTEQEV
jgi:C4-dicarboxylate-specific signal transduction histidine kinase